MHSQQKNNFIEFYLAENMSNLQKKNQNKSKASTSKRKPNLKRKMDYDDSESTNSVPSPTESIDIINFEFDEDVGIKCELMDYDDTEADPPAVSQGTYLLRIVPL